jgi:hypothetical protein
MSTLTGSPSARTDAVRRAIEHAQQVAGSNDAAFVRALNEHFHQSVQAAAPTRALRVVPAVAEGPRSFQSMKTNAI